MNLIKNMILEPLLKIKPNYNFIKQKIEKNYYNLVNSLIQ